MGPAPMARECFQETFTSLGCRVRMQHCDQTCSHCAREWWAWLKSREGQMRRPLKGNKTSWSDAALTSVKAPNPEEGARVRVPSLPYEHEAVVVMHAFNGPGADGREWLRVAVTTPLGGDPWEVHVEKHMVVRVS